MEAVQASNETARLTTLYHYEILDSPSEEIFDNLTRLAALSCGTSIAAINFVDANRQWFKSSVGLKLREVPRDIGFCPLCIQQRDILIITDTLADGQMASNPVVTSDPYVRFYAGVPLITSEGHAIGTLCVVDSVPRQLTTQQVEVLRLLSQQVVYQLEVRRKLFATTRTRTDWQPTAASVWESQYPYPIVTDDLERRVTERTAELAQSDTLLQQEMSECRTHRLRDRLLAQKVSRTSEAQLLLDLKVWNTDSGDLNNTQQEMIGAIVVNQDITEQQLVEKALWQNQRLTQQIAAATPVILYLYDLIEQRNIYTNYQITETLGYSPQQIQQMGSGVLLKLIHPDDWFKVTESHQQLMTSKDGEIIEIEYRMQHVNGEWRWLCSRDTVFSRSANGLAHQILGTAQDITERKHAEETLQESKERFQSAFESAAIGMALVALDGRWLQVNRSLCEIVGYSESELLAMNDQAITHPDDWETDLNYMRQLLAGEIHALQREKRYFHKQGRIIWVFLSVSLVRDTRGQPLYCVSQIKDITERKQAEQKIREQAALLDSTTDAILVRDLENQILFWNKGAELLYGWKTEQVLGKNATEILSPEAASSSEAARKVTFEKGEWQGELHQVTKEGTKVIVHSHWTLIEDEAGQPKSIFTVNTNITEKKQLEAQFLRAQRMESIGTLAGGIAHDLNNVLAPILMAIQLLEKKLTDEQSQRLLKTLEMNAKRGADLVKQVLSFARGIEANRTILQVRHLISEIKQIAKETFPKLIEFNTEIPNDLWMVYGNATQLHQVLMNLCVNARDAMPDGGMLTISATNEFIDENYARMNIEAQVGPYIVITVSDTGTGIPQEIIERIFEPFFTTKEVGQGTGIGLSTVSSIIKNNGGFVKVYSEVGKGTQFRVYLPALESTETQLVKEELREIPTGNGELVLVVDDEAAIREISKESLETYAYKVLTASDGLEAIALYMQHQQDIRAVLVDMMMPSMDGVTTIRTLQRINPQVKLVVVSGLTLTHQLAKVEGLGVSAFLSKPYTAKELLNTIHSAISDGQ